MFFRNTFVSVFIIAASVNYCSSISEDSGGPYPVKGEKNVPADFKIPVSEQLSLQGPDFRVYLYSQNFKQGDAVYIECLDCAPGIKNIECDFFDKEYSLSERRWGFRGFIPIDPDIKPGKKILSLKYRENNRFKSYDIIIRIKKAPFKTVYKSMYLGRYSHQQYLEKEENVKRIEHDIELKNEAFTSDIPDQLSAVITHPRDFHFITSEFWYKRVYKEYSIENRKRVLNRNIKIHRGVDLRGDVGSPVYAMERGVVVLARRLFFEGNMVILDHGNRIFSYYMHLHEIHVDKGDLVKSGEEIGAVGESGRVTGSHLHVSFVINGVQVDPLSLFSLPIRR